MKKVSILIIGIVVIIAAALVLHSRSQSSSSSATNSVAKSSTTSESPQPTPSSFDKNKLSVTDPSSIWVVVNKQHPLSPKEYAPTDLANAGNGQQLRSEAAKALEQMYAAASKEGWTLYSASGYRSYTTQVSVYNKEVTDYGQARADSESARPGYSEHQTGLAMDIGAGGCSIADCFGATAEGKWAAANAYKYGFILRYTSENTSVTGYRAESWHFRYVGTELSEEMHREGVTTLEQFFGVTGGSTYQ